MKNAKKYLTDKEYQFIFERVPRLCLDFIIVKDHTLLLSKRTINPYAGYWHLPGGMVRYRESLAEAATRILVNELGLAPVSKRLVGYIEFPDEINQNNLRIHSVSMAFLTNLAEGQVTGSDQARQIKFFESLPAKTHPGHKQFLKEHWGLIMKK